MKITNLIIIIRDETHPSKEFRCRKLHISGHFSM